MHLTKSYRVNAVKASSARHIFGKTDVDGGLIGGASLQAQDFIDIVNSI